MIDDDGGCTPEHDENKIDLQSDEIPVIYGSMLRLHVEGSLSYCWPQIAYRVCFINYMDDSHQFFVRSMPIGMN